MLPHHSILSTLENEMKLSTLDDACFLEYCKSTFLIDGFDGFGREGESDVLLQFRNINSFFLKIGVAATSSHRVKLRRTSAVGISAANL